MPTDSNTSVAAAEKPVKKGPLKSLYLWVLRWADSPYGTPALFVLSFTESSFFPIPPDVLQIALSVSKPRRSFYYAMVSGIGSVCGAIFGWFIGYALWTSMGMEGFFNQYVPGCSPENIAFVGEKYQENAFAAILLAGFTPIPYKVFTISAGVFHQYVSLYILITASIIGRFARFFSVATCIFFFGPKVKELIEKYFGLVTFLLAAMVIAGFVVIKYFLR